MKSLVLGIVVALFLCASATAGWYDAGGGYAYWLGSDGRNDGYIYQKVSSSYGHAEYRNLGDYHQFFPQQLPPGQAPQAAPQAAPQQGPQQQSQQSQQPSAENYGVEQNWRSKLLTIAAAKDEHRQYLQAIESLGLKGVYGVDSPSGSMSAYSAQFGGAYNGVRDLPLQQSNTVYGSTDPTYNALADPFRSFDIGASLNQLSSLATQVETGSARVRGDFAQTLQQSTESYRLIRETESRIAGLNEQMRIYSEAIKANGSQVYRKDVESSGGGVVPFQGPAAPQGPPQSGPGAPRTPSGEGPPAEGPGAAAATAPTAERLVSIVGSKCLRCHGGADTREGQKLRMGEGRIVKFDGVNQKLAAAIGEKVAANEMPPGGKLSSAEKAVFAHFFASSAMSANQGVKARP